MTTNFTEIFDSFIILVQDYRLITLYQTSETNFNTYLSGWLLYAINEFSPTCNQSLTYTTPTPVAPVPPATEPTVLPPLFDLTLTEENKLILAQLMTKYWLQKEVQDITQMNLHIQDKDFRTFSEANGLREKMNAYNSKQEELSNLLVGYGYRNASWSDWFQGNFA
jgi:hypothetical protein